jgi:hypothetical protein
MNSKGVIILAAVLYIAAAGASYYYFSGNIVNQGNYKSPSSTISKETGTTVDTGPKTEECPMNGAMYSKAQRAKWESRRPLGIMVENSLDARPQSGLSSADVIYEAVAEGGITRFLTVWYCQDAKIVGPVRSARMYFLRLIQGYGDHPLYAHVGGANTPGPADALGEIGDLGWNNYNDMNQFGVPFPNYWRDYDRLPGVVTEHTMYTDTTKLWSFAAKNRKLTEVNEEGTNWDKTFTPWKFQDDAKSKGKVAKISYAFWDKSAASYADSYGVQWNYDLETNTYKRVNGGKPHLDKNTGKQIAAKNVIVMFATEKPANDGYEGGHLLYGVIGSGDAIVFQNGEASKGKWSKKTAEDPVIFTVQGKEVEMVRGQVWVSILPVDNKVTY